MKIVSWAGAPYGATHYLFVKANSSGSFYKIVDYKLRWYSSDGEWLNSSHPVELLLSGGDEYYSFIPRVKPRILYTGNYHFVEFNGDKLQERFIREASAATYQRNVKAQKKEINNLFSVVDNGQKCISGGLIIEQPCPHCGKNCYTPTERGSI